MNFNYLFCLKGYGYLKDFVQQRGQWVAIILAMTCYQATTLSKDEVWIHCVVNETSLQARLAPLWRSVCAGQEVMLRFKAEYGAFINAHTGLAPNDPDHIITLQSKLRMLEDCYINGRPAICN